MARPKKPKLCIDCGIEVSNGAKRCKSCRDKLRVINAAIRKEQLKSIPVYNPSLPLTELCITDKGNNTVELLARQNNDAELCATYYKDGIMRAIDRIKLDGITQYSVDLSGYASRKGNRVNQVIIITKDTVIHAAE
jgi:hypothetical protein